MAIHDARYRPRLPIICLFNLFKVLNLFTGRMKTALKAHYYPPWERISSLRYCLEV